MMGRSKKLNDALTSKLSQNLALILVGFLLVLYLAVLIRTAWISDDAYFTFRTIDQLASGNGLVWNVGERVQAYTHPLWLFQLSLGFFFTHEFWLTTIVLSGTLTLLAACVYAFFIARSRLSAIAGVCLLISSKAFVDYSTSGLENPLAYFLLAIFGFTWFRSASSARRALVLGLVGAGILLCRQDYLLLIGPALLVSAFDYSLGAKGRRAALIAGLSPLIAWEVFSILYYGFPIPNTAYAKLGVGIPRHQQIGQGIYYLVNSLRNDPVTLPTILLAAAMVARSDCRSRGLSLLVGVISYLGYVVWIGGDFMSGRFLVAPFLVSVFMLGDLALPPWNWVGLAALGMWLGLMGPYPSLPSGADYGTGREDVIDEWGIADERAYYYQGTGLMHLWRRGEMPDHSEMYRAINARGEIGEALVVSSAGMFGFYAGRDVHLVDQFGLGDPLLARLTPEPIPGWRPGHPWRRVPTGYVETLLSGSNRIDDPHLHQFYDLLTLVVSGDLRSMDRIWAIILFNLGQYDHLVKAYEDDQYLKVNLSNLSDPESGEVPLDPDGRVEMPGTGIEINLPDVVHPKSIGIAVEGGSEFGIMLRRGNTDVWLTGVNLIDSGPGIQTVHLRVPLLVRLVGLDQIRLRPVLTDHRFSILEPAFD